MAEYELTLSAEEDLRDIWTYTFDTWGADQADRYLDQIERCCDVIGAGHARSKSIDQLPDEIRIHRCEHHYVVWIVGPRPIIIAFLHERMDFVQRLRDRL
ncbi:MAG: plasmid stabilization protein [Thalassobium sp.]|nr:MAG: plasmid stabilization protein [Thalassobium sp.]